MIVVDLIRNSEFGFLSGLGFRPSDFLDRQTSTIQ
jgi:hypothetical protein